MNRSVFFKRFTSLLRGVKEKTELDSIHDALIFWTGVNYIGIEDDECKERIVSDRCAEGIDGILVDNNDFVLYIVSGKTVTTYKNTKKNFPENSVKLALAGAKFITKGEYRGKITPQLENLVDEYQELQNTGEYEVKMLFIVLQKDPVARKYIDEFEKEFSIKVEFLDIDKIQDFYENKYLARLNAPPAKVSIDVIDNILKKEKPRRARVFTCKAKDIARIYMNHGESIFQKGVRYFLGRRAKSINESIYETASVAKKSRDFWYYNNGITMICRNLKETPNGKILHLERMQIINGTQTTYALADAYSKGKLKDSTQLLVKVIVEQDEAFIGNVALYTNYQNPIKLRDLCSNLEIQTKIQKVLLDVYGYFYERKRGEFDSLHPTASAKSKLLGRAYKKHVISNEKAAQGFLALFLNRPAEAKSEKKRIFVRDEHGFYKDIFKVNDQLLPEKLLASWKLLKFIEREKKDYKRLYKQAETKSQKKRGAIYKYDFLLHSEYFVLNLFGDYLKVKGIDINQESGLIKLHGLLENDDGTLSRIYDKIKNLLGQYVSSLKREEPTYYHNKFFKNEKSIGSVRQYLRQDKQLKFIRLIE